jgi:hypothetical protein
LTEETTQHPDGIYFGMPAEEYHAQRRLSASGLQEMDVSPATYWARSWMNPDKQERDTKALRIGTAYHMARLEPARFEQSYLPEPDAAEARENGTLMTHADIKEQFKLIGEPQTKTGEDVLAAAERLKAAGYGGAIWHIIQAEFAARLEAEQKTGLPRDSYDEIVRDMKSLHGMPEIHRHLIDGLSEVSVLWTDKKTGVRMKCRMDYLQTTGFTDLKTFDNALGKKLDKHINDSVLYNRYYLQAALYWEAAEIIRTTTNAELPVQPGASMQAMELIETIRQRAAPMECWYVFQEKRGIPNVLARQFRIFAKPAPSIRHNAADEDQEETLAQMRNRKTMWATKADLMIRHLIGLWRDCMEVYGTEEPWRPFVVTGDIDDESFPLRWLEE